MKKRKINTMVVGIQPFVRLQVTKAQHILTQAKLEA